MAPCVSPPPTFHFPRGVQLFSRDFGPTIGWFADQALLSFREVVEVSCCWRVGVPRFGGCRKRTSEAWVAGREYAAEARGGPALLVQAVCQFEWAGRQDYRAW